MWTVKAVDLPPVAQTLLVPLACRARETARKDAILRDPCAVDLFERIDGGMDCLMGMSEMDQTFTVMRARHFDTIAQKSGSPPAGQFTPAGSAVVLDPKSGNIIAMASYPTYDPSEFVNGISTDAIAAKIVEIAKEAEATAGISAAPKP